LISDKRKNLLKEKLKKPSREVEQCDFCQSIGEMNRHVTELENKVGAKEVKWCFCDNLCMNAWEIEQGHVET